MYLISLFKKCTIQDMGELDGLQGLLGPSWRCTYNIHIMQYTVHVPGTHMYRVHMFRVHYVPSTCICCLDPAPTRIKQSRRARYESKQPHSGDHEGSTRVVVRGGGVDGVVGGYYFSYVSLVTSQGTGLLYLCFPSYLSLIGKVSQLVSLFIY